MSLIEKMMDATSAFFKDVDKVDIELTSLSHGTDAILYAVVTGKNVSVRQQIKPKHKKNGVCEIKLKQGTDILESIYSWCGFKWLEIKLDLSIRTNEQFEAVAGEAKSLKCFDTSPGWLSLPPIFFHPFMQITISFVEKTPIPSDYNSVLIKTTILQNPERLELKKAIGMNPAVPGDDARVLLALGSQEKS
jgi:hypothetical protein